jgi:2-dehydropantoate 2-reductase
VLTGDAHTRQVRTLSGQERLRVVMKILVYGAGVQGSVYAAHLKRAGNDVAVLARGDRLEDIRTHGIVLRELPLGADVATQVDAVERLDPADYYDLVIVAVRRDQLRDILPHLGANSKVATFLFLLNNATGFEEIIRFLARSRVLAGLPTVGGYRESHVINYTLVPQQPTTLGELSGKSTPRLKNIRKVMERAGFPVVISHDVDALLKTHVAFIIAVAGALYLAKGDNYRLAKMPEVLTLMVTAVAEGFRALQVQRIKVTPFKLRVLFLWLPPIVAMMYWKRYLDSARGECTMARHARVAVDEMKELANEWRVLQSRSPVKTPALDQLCASIDQH